MASHVDRAWIKSAIKAFNVGALGTTRGLAQNVTYHLGVGNKFTPEMLEVLSGALYSKLDHTGKRPKIDLEPETIVSYVRAIMNSAAWQRQESLVKSALAEAAKR